MKIIGKKGEWKTLSAIIISAIFAVVVLGFLLPPLARTMTREGDKKACQAWVSIQAGATPGGIPVKEINSACTTQKEEFETGDKEKLYESLAYSMYDCWDMYGRGKTDFLSDLKLPWEKYPFYCFICSRITVDKKGELDMDEFAEYLNTYSPPHHKQTYAQFFLDSDKSGITFGNPGEPYEKIILEPEVPLYVMFHVQKKMDISSGDAWKRLLSKFAVVGGVATGTASIPFVGKLLIGAVTKHPIGVLVASTMVAGGIIMSDAGEFYPSLAVVSGKDVTQDFCRDNIYYNPKKNLLSFLEKESPEKKGVLE
jgi:hypothetical protein